MARPVKTGLDYFSMDVHLDNKFQLIEAIHGIVGFAVVVKLYQKIYGEEGYYCEWSPEVSILFARACGVEYEKVSAILADAMRWKLFSEDMLDNHSILTSAGIQKRYIEATARRKQVDIKREYLLLDVQSLPENVCINGVNVDNNSINACRSTQSKGKNTKSNKTKSKNNKINYSDDAVSLTIEAYASNNLQYLSPRNMEELADFKTALSDELVMHAVDEACARGIRTWNYVRGILMSYQRKGFKTIGEAKADKEAYAKQKESFQQQRQQKAPASNPALNYTQRTETNYSSTFINLLDEYGGESK